MPRVADIRRSGSTLLADINSGRGYKHHPVARCAARQDRKHRCQKKNPHKHSPLFVRLIGSADLFEFCNRVANNQGIVADARKRGAEIADCDQPIILDPSG
jgi:hypothetical protein